MPAYPGDERAPDTSVRCPICGASTHLANYDVARPRRARCPKGHSIDVRDPRLRKFNERALDVTSIVVTDQVIDGSR
jgi:ribosomal protein S27AE